MHLRGQRVHVLQHERQPRDVVADCVVGVDLLAHALQVGGTDGVHRLVELLELVFPVLDVADAVHRVVDVRVSKDHRENAVSHILVLDYLDQLEHAVRRLQVLVGDHHDNRMPAPNLLHEVVDHPLVAEVALVAHDDDAPVLEVGVDRVDDAFAVAAPRVRDVNLPVRIGHGRLTRSKERPEPCRLGEELAGD